MTANADSSPTARLGSALGVRPGERRAVALMLLHAFAMGTATVFFETAANALFVSRFEARLLAWVYLAAAAVSIGVGVIYQRLVARLAFSRLMAGTLVLLLAMVLGAEAGLALTQAAALIFSLLIFYRLLSALTDLEYWAVAARLFDVRQGKRLFALIGSGEVVARILGALSVPLLVPWLGVEHLLGLSAAGVAGCLAVLALLRRSFPAALGGAAEEASAEGARHRLAGSGLARDRYLHLLFALMAFAILGKYFVDFAFLQQSKLRFAQAAELAAFFGLFSGIAQLVNMAVRTLLSGRILSRFGLRTGLSLLPAAHLLCTVGILAAAYLAGAPAAVFWLTVANQGLYKTLKHPIDNPSFKLLYQPLARRRRLAAQVAVEVIVTPAATGVAGALILAAGLLFSDAPRHFAWVMLAVFAGWIAVAFPAAGAYRRALVAALTGARRGQAPLALDDPETRHWLAGRLDEVEGEAAVTAARMLEQAGEPPAGELYDRLLRHRDPVVRRHALARIAELGLADLAPALGAAAGDPEPATAARALAALATLGGPEGRRAAAARLADASPEVRCGAAEGLLASGDDSHRDAAVAALDGLARSPQAGARALAAQAMAAAGDDALVELHRELLADPEPAVRRAALAAAGRRYRPALWPALLERLADPAGAATSSVVAAGEAVLPQLAATLAQRQAPPPVLERLARAAGRIGGPAAIAALRGGLEHPNTGLRRQVLAALSLAGYRAAEGETLGLERRIESELVAAEHRLAALADLDLEEDDAVSGALDPLVRALEHEIAGAGERVLLLLSFGLPPAPLLAARANLGHADRERRAYALELVDLAAPAAVKARLLPLLERLPPERRLALLPGTAAERHERDERLAALAAGEELGGASIAAWTRDCARFAAAGLPGPAGALPPLPRAVMHTVEKVLLLRGVDLFADTADEVLAEVAGILDEVRLAAGETLISEGEVGSSLYLMVDGRVRVHRGERTLTHLGAGEIVGELALLDPEPRSASVTAVEDSRTFRLDRDPFLALMADHDEIASGVLRVLCRRLRDASSRGSVPNALESTETPEDQDTYATAKDPP